MNFFQISIFIDTFLLILYSNRFKKKHRLQSKGSLVFIRRIGFLCHLDLKVKKIKQDPRNPEVIRVSIFQTTYFNIHKRFICFDLEKKSINEVIDNNNNKSDNK